MKTYAVRYWKCGRVEGWYAGRVTAGSWSEAEYECSKEYPSGVVEGVLYA